MTHIAHIGDIHSCADNRQPDRLAALDWIIEGILALPSLGLTAIPGDLFDGTSGPEDRNALDERLQRLASRAPVLICDGNHDPKGDLDGFARLQSAWPIYVHPAKAGTVRMKLATGAWATIFVLPYPHKGGLVGAGVAAGDVVSTAMDLLEPIFVVAASELEAAAAAGDLTCLFGHVNVAGAITSTGQPNIGREIELPARLLDRLGPIYKGLNHIHKPQEIAGAWYPGSIVPQTYGEHEAKRYLVIEFEAGGRSANREAPIGPWSYQVRAIPIPCAPMFLVEGVLSPAGFVLDDADAEVVRRFLAHDWAGCDVRVRYRYQASERAVLNPARLQDLFAGALRLKTEGRAIPDRDLRSPAVASATTVSQKLAAYMKAETLAAPVEQKLSALEQLEAAELLASVDRSVAAVEAS